MWADLFDPRWFGGMVVALSTLGLLGIIVMLIWLFGEFRRRPDVVDPDQPVWRRFEQGDLTREELEWLRPARATFLPLTPRSARRRAMQPAASAAAHTVPKSRD